MKKIFFITLLTSMLFSCSDGGSGVNSKSLSIGDSLFVDNNLNISVTGRVHRTNGKGYIDGHPQVDSNKLESVFSKLDREFFFKRKTTFVGTFQKKCKYDADYIILNLEKEIKNEILKNKELFGKKVIVDKNKFYSGAISKGKILENFPSEIYIRINELNTSSADSVFNVLK
jgi:hypothetical protein